MARQIERGEAERLDAEDPLAAMRERFALDDGRIYLDGNSLGALVKAIPERLERVVAEEWGRNLIHGWFEGWMALPRRAGARIARLIGAERHEVLAADSTSINLYKLAVAALTARPERSVILTEESNFPTDLYILDGLASHLGRPVEVKRVPAEELRESIDETVALVTLSHVHYKTAAVWDMADVTARAQGAGALTLWDLSHSAGAIPVGLNAAKADLAVGCGYKFLNGGPGAPAFLYVAERHQGLASPLSGWMGHASPFDFAPDYRPATGIDRFACGTPPVIALSALEAALEVFEATDIDALHAKAMRLTEFFIALTEELPDIRLVSPRESTARGSQVSLAHPEGGKIMERLAERGIVGDFRPPDVMRFGFAPLYNRFTEAFDAATALRAEIAALGGAAAE